MVIHSHNEVETHKVAADLLTKNKLDEKAIVFALSGPLGAGKTRLAKGIALALDINPNQIISPTYVLETEYKIPNSEKLFIHIDAYRMESVEELIRLGIENRIKHKDIIVIEWADKFAEEIKKLSNENIKIVWVKLEYGKNENEREIEIIYN